MLALADEQQVDLGAKARKELDKALLRCRKAPSVQTTLKLKSCDLKDAQVCLLMEALRSYPAVDKVDLRANPKIGAAGMRAVVELVEAQIASGLRPLSTERLRTDAFSRRFHGVMSDGVVRQTCCLRRVKLDARSNSKSERERLRCLESLAVRANERLAIRHAFLRTAAVNGTLNCDMGTATLAGADELIKAAIEAIEAAALDPRKVTTRGFEKVALDGLEPFEAFVFSRLERQSLLGPPSPEELAILGPVLVKHDKHKPDHIAVPDLDGDHGERSPLTARSVSAFSDDTTNVDESTIAGTILSAQRTDDEAYDSSTALTPCCTGGIESRTPEEEENNGGLEEIAVGAEQYVRELDVESEEDDYNEDEDSGEEEQEEDDEEEEDNTENCDEHGEERGDEEQEKYENERERLDHYESQLHEELQLSARLSYRQQVEEMRALQEGASQEEMRASVDNTKRYIREQTAACKQECQQESREIEAEGSQSLTSHSRIAALARREMPLSQRLAMLERELPEVCDLSDGLPEDDELDEEDELGEEDDDVLSPREVVEQSYFADHPMARPPFRLTAASLRAAADRDHLPLTETRESTDRAREAFDSLVESRLVKRATLRGGAAAAALEAGKPGRCIEGRLSLSERGVVGSTLLPEIDASMLAVGEQYVCLASLDVSRNRLRWLPVEVFARLTALQVLDCSHNHLRHLAPSVSPPLSSDETAESSPRDSRRSLTCRGQRFALPGTLVHIDASHNSLESLHGLEACAFLRVARFGHNALTSARGLEHFAHLEELDLSYNEIERQTALRPLSCILTLRSLKIRGCPIDGGGKRTGSSQRTPQALSAALDTLSSRLLLDRLDNKPSPLKQCAYRARAFIVGLLPQLRDLDNEPMPRSAMATLERVRRTSLRSESEVASSRLQSDGATDAAAMRCRRQREADTKRCDYGKTILVQRRLDKRNMGGDVSSSNTLEPTNSLLTSSSKRRTKDEQMRAMDALMRECAKSPRAKVEPARAAPRVFGQPWSEPPPPPRTKLPSGNPGASAGLEAASRRRSTSLAGSDARSTRRSDTSSPSKGAHHRFRKRLASKLRENTMAARHGRDDGPPRNVLDASAPPLPAPPLAFDKWLQELLRYSTHAENAIAVLEKLHKVRGSRDPNELRASAPADRELVQPFRETLARLTGLATSSPPESALEAIVSAPQQLKLAATSWNKARHLVVRLRGLVEPILNDENSPRRRRPSAAAARRAASHTVPCPADDDNDDLTTTLASLDASSAATGRHPLANFAQRLEFELVRIKVEPSDDQTGSRDDDSIDSPNRLVSQPASEPNQLATALHQARVAADNPLHSPIITGDNALPQETHQPASQLPTKPTATSVADDESSARRQAQRPANDEMVLSAAPDPHPDVTSTHVPPVDAAAPQHVSLRHNESSSPATSNDDIDEVRTVEEGEQSQINKASPMQARNAISRLRNRLRQRQLIQPKTNDDESTGGDESLVWRQGYDDKRKRFFYFNEQSGESTWIEPSARYKPYDTTASTTSESDDGDEDDVTAASVRSVGSETRRTDVEA